MTFIEKKDISYKNNIGNIKNLEIEFQDESYYNNIISQSIYNL